MLVRMEAEIVLPDIVIASIWWTQRASKRKLMDRFRGQEP
jgi:hypothetical protein